MIKNKDKNSAVPLEYVDMWRVGGESRYNFIEIKMPESDAACCALLETMLRAQKLEPKTNAP